MPKVIAAFVFGEFTAQLAQARPERVDAPLAELAQQRLEFREDLFDRIEVGTVRWQIEQPRARGCNGLAHTGAFVAAEIIQHHDVIFLQRRCQVLLHASQEDFAVDRAVHHQRRSQSIDSQRCQKCRRFPMPVRDIIPHAFAARRPAASTRHVRFGPSLVDKNQLRAIQAQLLQLPASATLGHVRPLLLSGVDDFF